MPQADPGLRARLERLMAGDVRHEDLDRLFLYIRDRCDGRETIQEVGDFVAHHNERTKGILTRTAKDWYVSARFHYSMIRRPEGLDPSRLPPNFDQVLSASFRNADAQNISKIIGLRRLEVSKRLPAIVKGLKKNTDGSMSLNNFYTHKEMRIINGLSKMLTAKPAFTNDRLCSDLYETLRSLSLLKIAEKNDFENVKQTIGMFAVTVMHNCSIIVGKDVSVRLSVALPDNAVTIAAAVPVEDKTMGGPILLATAMFSTDLDAFSACAPDLIAVPTPWEFDIEMTRERQLNRLG